MPAYGGWWKRLQIKSIYMTTDFSHVFSLTHGTTPLLLSLPHCGQALPDWLIPRLTPLAQRVLDTDWYMPELYAFATSLGASVLQPNFSRYVVDLNRPPDNVPMYPGQNNTELCPTRNFRGEALYINEQAPSNAEVQQRVAKYWQPYHQALQAELDRIKSIHGYALLWDGHSILNTLPWLFDGTLPDLNIGTVNATSCDPTLRNALSGVLQKETRFTSVIDGRFKGGYITRHYGNPDLGVHAVQMEMCFSAYMPCNADYEQNYHFDATYAAPVQATLCKLFETMLAWKPV